MYCEHCMSESLQCALCGAPARAGHRHGGRIFCDLCEPQLLHDAEALRSLYEVSIQRLSEDLGLELEVRPELRIVELSAIDPTGLDSSHSLEALGGLFTREPGGHTVIQLVSPVTKPRAQAVLAHELAHAWQAQHCPDNQGKRLREGFAEWVAWHALGGIEECVKERRKIELRTDEYGLGFQLFRGLEERNGWDGVLHYARSAQNPIGGVEPARTSSAGKP